MAAKLLPPMQFITALSPKYSEPRHLAPLADAFERSEREPVHAAFFAPPGVEKTDTTAHFVVREMKRNPAKRICYATYGQRLSVKKSRRIRQLALRAGVKIDKSSASTSDWRTGVEEGGLWATSVGGAVVGERFDLIVLDDLVKDRIAAENALARERTYEWTVELTAREEPGASSILIMHRWHTADVGGRLVRDGWEEHVFPALDDAGRALCPERFSVAQLESIRERIGEYAWESLYMQRPRPRGGALFTDVHTYDSLPEGVPLAIVIGNDFAYSARTSADYSVAVVLATDGETYFVLDVVRMQVKAPAFRSELERLRREHVGAQLVAYIGGQEGAVLDLFREGGLHIDATPARGDKFTRAQPVAAAWNAGKVLIPAARTPWRDAFVGEVCGFTGTNDRYDDQVDALTSAYDAVAVAARCSRGPSLTEINARLSAAIQRDGLGSRWGAPSLSEDALTRTSANPRGSGWSPGRGF